jgi:hypothetical protein
VPGTCRLALHILLLAFGSSCAVTKIASMPEVYDASDGSERDSDDRHQFPTHD